MDTASSESVIPTFGVCILCSFKNTVMSFFLKFFLLHTCLWATFVYGALDGQKRTLDPLKLELQMVLSYHVGAGN